MTSSRRSRAWRSRRDENSLTAKLEAVVQQLGIEVPQSGSLIALLDAFTVGVSHWFDQGQLSEEAHEDLIADAERSSRPPAWPAVTPSI